MPLQRPRFVLQDQSAAKKIVTPPREFSEPEKKPRNRVSDTHESLSPLGKEILRRLMLGTHAVASVLFALPDRLEEEDQPQNKTVL